MVKEAGFLISLLFKKVRGRGGGHLPVFNIMALGVGAYLGEGGYSRKYGTANKYIAHHLILYFRVFTKACTVSGGAVFSSNLLKGKFSSIIMRKKTIFYIQESI